jgi:hypothetical protein
MVLLLLLISILFLCHRNRANQQKKQQAAEARAELDGDGIMEMVDNPHAVRAKVVPNPAFYVAAANQHQQPQEPNPAPTTPTSTTFYDSTLVEESEVYSSLDTENPLAGLADLPYCTLEDAAAHAQMHCGGGLLAEVRRAKLFAAQLAADNRLGVLSESEAAVVNLYTRETPLYRHLNGALGGHGAGGRTVLHHYLPYINLLQTALLKLPPQSSTIVYRGIRLPLNTVVPNANVGQKVVWWAFTSTSHSKMRSKMFLDFGAEAGGGVGNRTIFQISSNDGRDISRYSSYGDDDDVNEEEVILLPGSQFIIDTICPYACDIEEVQMHQLTPDYATATEGEEPLYAEPVDPPVYDNTKYDLLEDVYAAAGGGVVPVDYSASAGSITIGVNNVMVNGIDQQYESIGADSKCTRPAPAGGTCTHPVLPGGGQFCKSHACPECGAGKSSSVAACPAHLAARTRKKQQRKSSADNGFNAAEHDAEA